MATTYEDDFDAEEEQDVMEMASSFTQASGLHVEEIGKVKSCVCVWCYIPGYPLVPLTSTRGGKEGN